MGMSHGFVVNFLKCIVHRIYGSFALRIVVGCFEAVYLLKRQEACSDGK